MQGDNIEIEAKLKARHCVHTESQLRKRDDQTSSEGRKYYWSPQTVILTQFRLLVFLAVFLACSRSAPPEMFPLDVLLITRS